MDPFFANLTKSVSFEDAKNLIHDSDLLLFRNNNLISKAGRGIHSHVGKAAWWGDQLFCLEIREYLGGRAVLLSNLVKQYPRRIDCFCVNPDNRWPNYNRLKALDAMKQMMGTKYGYQRAFRTVLQHVPFFRWILSPRLTNDSYRNNRSSDPHCAIMRPTCNSLSQKLTSHYCSEACAFADRMGGVDPVPFLADEFVEPSDLARSLFYQYVFTLDI